MKKLIIIILIIIFSLFTLFNNTIEGFIPRRLKPLNTELNINELKFDLIANAKKAASKLGPPKPNLNKLKPDSIVNAKKAASRLKERLAKIKAGKAEAPVNLPRQKGASKLKARMEARANAKSKTKTGDLRKNKTKQVKSAPKGQGNSVSLEQGYAKNQGGMGKKPEQRRRTSGSGSGNEKFMKNLGIKQAKDFAGEKTRIQDYLDEIKVVDGELKKISLLNSIIEGKNVQKNVKSYNELFGSKSGVIKLKDRNNNKISFQNIKTRAIGIEKKLSRKITLETKLETLKTLKREKIISTFKNKMDELRTKLKSIKKFNQRNLTPFEKVKELKKIEVEESNIDPKDFQKTEETVQLGDLSDSLNMKLDDIVDMEFMTSLRRTESTNFEMTRLDIEEPKVGQKNINELSDAVKKSDLSPKIKNKLEDKLESARLNIKNREALKAQKLKDMTEKATLIQRFLRATRIRPQKNIDVLTDFDVKTAAKSMKKNKTDSIVGIDTKGKNATEIKEIEEVKKSVDSIIKPSMKNKKWIAPLVLLSMAGVAGATAIAIVLSEQNDDEASYNETLEDMKGSGIDINDNTNTANLSGVVNSENLNSDGTIKDPNEELKKIQKELDQMGKSTINDQINEAFDDIASLFGLPKSGNIFKWATLGILILIILLLFYFMLFSGSNSEEEEYIEDDYYMY